jgi:hypothetical protein
VGQGRDPARCKSGMGEAWGTHELSQVWPGTLPPHSVGPVVAVTPAELRWCANGDGCASAPSLGGPALLSSSNPNRICWACCEARLDEQLVPPSGLYTAARAALQIPPWSWSADLSSSFALPRPDTLSPPVKQSCFRGA